MKKNSVFDYVVVLLCVLLLTGVSVFLFVYWDAIPDKIPGHYNAAGEIDRWTKKAELIILPIVAWVLFVLMSVVEQFPSLWNTGVRVTQANMYRVYRLIKTMLGLLKMEMTAMFVFMSVYQALTLPLPAVFLPVTLSVVFGTTIWCGIALIRAR